jgi:hypothetical protein
MEYYSSYDEESIQKAKSSKVKKMTEEGAKWQAERMYSEEEVLKLLVNFSNDRTFLKKDVVIRWFEQFKKKVM